MHVNSGNLPPEPQLEQVSLAESEHSNIPSPESLLSGEQQARHDEFVDVMSKARLDTSQAAGNIATRLVLSDDEGRWIIPLKSGIDIVDIQDRHALRKIPPYLSFERNADTPKIIVSWTGKDDAVRQSELSTSEAYFELLPPNEERVRKFQNATYAKQQQAEYDRLIEEENKRPPLDDDSIDVVSHAVSHVIRPPEIGE